MMVFLIFFFLLPPELNFKYIEKDNFRVFYYSNDTVGFYVADIVDSLKKELDFKEEINIVVIDNFDPGNGFTYVFPFNTVLITLSPSDIKRYKRNWIYKVLKHEIIHVISLSKKGMIFKLWRAINLNGTYIPPQYFLPPLVIEGIPTSEEGRINFFEGIIRAQIRENKFPSVSEVLVSPEVRWPGGYSSYIYGYKFINFLKKRYGKKKIEKFLNLNSNIPYFDFSFKRIFKKSKEEIWKEFVDYLRKEYNEKYNEISEEGLREGKSIIDNIYFLKNIKVYKNKVFYIEDSPDNLPSIYMNNKKIYSGFLSSSFAVGENKVYFVEYEFKDNFYYYGDLYRLNLENKKKKRLTKNLRVKYVDYCDKTQKLIAVIQEEGTDNLVLLDTFGNVIEKLTHNKNNFVHYDYPSFSPDGKKLVLTISDNYNYPDLFIFDLENKNFNRLTEDTLTEIYPSFSSDGKKIVFSKDKDGIYNLYVYDLKENKLVKITNTIGGAFFPCFRNDSNIVFGLLKDKGFSLNEINLKGFSVHEEKEDYKDNNIKNLSLKSYSYKIKRYRFYKLRLSSFTPFIVLRGRELNLIYGLNLYFQDILGYNYLLLGTEPLFKYNTYWFYLSYNNFYTYPFYNLTGAIYYDNNLREIPFGSISLALGFLKLTNPFKDRIFWFGIGYGWLRYSEIKEPEKALFYLRHVILFFSLQYRNIYNVSKSISKERGVEFSFLTNFIFNTLNLKFYFPSFGRFVFAHRFFIGDAFYYNFFRFVRGIYIPSFLINENYPLSGAINYTIEFRFPMVYKEKLILNTPFYLDRVYGKLYIDFGIGIYSGVLPTSWVFILSFDQYPDILKWMFSHPRFLGLEFVSDLKLFYNFPLKLRVGTGYSLMGERFKIYFTIGESF